MLVTNPGLLDKYSTNKIASKLKKTKYRADLLNYLNQRLTTVHGVKLAQNILVEMAFGETK
ncbi:hypothetical protein GQ600_8875 [Phytophthora cactorum]|nr:hypothetical protein GQ600_8875 [Phytophthora cactorum]